MGHVAQGRDGRCIQNFVKKPEIKELSGRLGHKWGVVIKLYLSRNTVWELLRVHWKAVVNMLIVLCAT